MGPRGHASWMCQATCNLQVNYIYGHTPSILYLAMCPGVQLHYDIVFAGGRDNRILNNTRQFQTQTKHSQIMASTTFKTKAHSLRTTVYTIG